MIYVIDTHILLWYLTDDDRLPEGHGEIISDSENKIIISTMVLVESIDVLKKKRIDYPLSKLLEEVTAKRSFLFKNIDMDIVMKLVEMNTELELHDRIIVSVAHLFDAKILTDDEKIKECEEDRVV